ncbi:MAG: hypothetical protein KGL18_15905 [Burkholderiales bacterium]|nr:hypothetical protein [Burkholderiales bacterium]MDE2160367.1 hypothetical protein [Burkholderiales bacterium]MDE2504448.1 hypothetical protein [Burkholderiales bacterium]
MIDELIATVARATGLPRPVAEQAVAAMLRFLTARLPSALVGEIHAQLRPQPGENAAHETPAHGP